MQGINDAFISYWRHSKYRPEQVDEICRAAEQRFMFIRAEFDGLGNAVLTLSARTWERKEGHFPTMAESLKGAAAHPRMRGLKGSLIVWLEDGLWAPENELSRHAPILTFGRMVRDSYAAVIPDPAFLESCGYTKDIEEVREWAALSPWEMRSSQLFWRGAASGIGIEGPGWLSSPRGKFVCAARDVGDERIIDAKFTRINHLPEQQKSLMISEGITGEVTPFRDFVKYKYAVDVDGYCCAWMSLFLKLVSGCATLKVTSDYEQWYFRHLKPWFNFIPIAYSAHDLRELHAWLLRNDEAVRQIARNGNAITEMVTFEKSFDALVEVLAETLQSCSVE